MFNKLRPAAIKRTPLTISLTDAEYRTLIRVLDIGQSVYGIMGDATDHLYKPVGEEGDRLLSLFLERAPSFGLQDEIEQFEGRSVLRDDSKLNTMGDLLEYEDYAMWEEMIRRLANRDLSRKYTDEEWRSMESVERIRLFCDAERKWSEEFEENGLDRLSVDESMEADEDSEDRHMFIYGG